MSTHKNDRFVIIPELNWVGSVISTNPESCLGLSENQFKHIFIETGDSEDDYFVLNFVRNELNTVYNFPLLLNDDGTPWNEANLFLYNKYISGTKFRLRTDELRRQASRLLDYKLYCEGEHIDIYDFTAKRPVNRPTYRYFAHLYENLGNSKSERQNINQKTKTIYEFYKYIIEFLKFDIDIDSVDNVSLVRAYIRTNRDMLLTKDYEKRQLSLRVSKATNPVPLGFVRDGGEDIRPLRSSEYKLLLKALNEKSFKIDERLAHYLALFTGIRKQTIYTLRLHHLEGLDDRSIHKYGGYLINAGPGTGADTKFDVPQDIYIPKELAKDLKRYVQSGQARERRRKFTSKYGEILQENDQYIFLSPHGNCYYMAKDDPRYLMVKTRPVGNNTDHMKKKLFKAIDKINKQVGKNGSDRVISFSKDFTFHWLRATFARLYYESLIPLVSKGQIKLGDEVSLVQTRMHHLNRETTEHYLKLFHNYDERIEAQNNYEAELFHYYKNDVGVLFK